MILSVSQAVGRHPGVTPESYLRWHLQNSQNTRSSWYNNEYRNFQYFVNLLSKKALNGLTTIRLLSDLFSDFKPLFGFFGIGGQSLRAAFDCDFIDQIGLVTGAEAIVNVNDGYARSTAVEHGEQGGNSTEASAVTNAGGNCNDRA